MYDEGPTREVDGESFGPVAWGPTNLWDIRWTEENATDVQWTAWGDNYRAKFGHWNGDDETIPYWKVETSSQQYPEWERCTDAEGELIAFTTKEGLHKYLRSELD